MQNGKDLIYTDKSPLPKEDQIIENEEIIF